MASIGEGDGEPPKSMNVLAAAVFLLIALSLSAAAIAVVLFIALDRLSGSEAIGRDGLARGSKAPPFRAADVNERCEWSVPTGRSTFLLFSDHSIREFPGAAAQLAQLGHTTPDVDVLILTMGNPLATHVTVTAMRLPFPTLAVSHEIYNRYRVRVMPYATVIDPHGHVAYAGLVGTGEAVLSAWRVGTILPAASAWEHFTNRSVAPS